MNARQQEELAMDQKFNQFLGSIKEKNRADKVALECASYILKRIHELEPGSRKYMLDVLTDLISGSPYEHRAHLN
jgi:hypothetical protein